ncbi:MAG TPA: DUF742 domain-containing protein [Pseudonocardia sp.]|nr:DUF742 domain-containing protein [Pseudonocardia sp.]
MSRYLDSEGVEFDEPARTGGRVVPVYALTGGRTRSGGRDMPVESLVTATGSDIRDLRMEYRTTVDLAAHPVSIVEIGAALRVPVGVARVLVGDLVDTGYLDIHLPPTVGEGGPTPEILERLLEGLRAR